MRQILWVVLFILFYTHQAFAGDDRWQFSVSANLHQNYWKPADDDDGSSETEDPFDYVTDAIGIWGTRFEAGLDGTALFHIEKQGSLKPSDHQQELLENNVSSQRGLDSLAAGLSPFILIDNAFLRGLRLDYRRDYFVGSAVAQVDSVKYLSESGSYDFVFGDRVSIVSDFEEWALTSQRKRGTRFGVYKTRTLKPISTSYYTIDPNTSATQDVVTDMEISSYGLMFLGESASSTFDVRLGQVKFHARQNLVNSAAFDSSGLDFMLRMAWHPTWWEPIKGMTVSPLVGGQFRMQFTSGGDPDRAAPLSHDGSDGDINMEFLFDLGIYTRYRF